MNFIHENNGFPTRESKFIGCLFKYPFNVVYTVRSRAQLFESGFRCIRHNASYRCFTNLRPLNRRNKYDNTPGPAQRIMDGTLSVKMSSRRTPVGPTRSSWPTNSSRDFGRMRSASGIASSTGFRFTFFCGGAGSSGIGSFGSVAADDEGLIIGHDPWLKPRLRGWVEKNPVTKED